MTATERNGDSHQQAHRLLGLIDGFAEADLKELSAREREKKLEIEASFAHLRKAKGLAAELDRKRQEFQEIDRQWKARSEIQDAVNRHQQLKSETRYLETLKGRAGQQFSDVAALARKVAESHVSFPDAETPHSLWFKQYDRVVKDAKDLLAETIEDAIAHYESAVENARLEDPAWPNIQSELSGADARFRAACEAKGLTTDDVGRLQEIGVARSNKEAEIEAAEAELLKAKEEAGNPDALVSELADIWRGQFEKRKEAADRANDAATLHGDGQRFIEASVSYTHLTLPTKA